jgi:hypothetical protein
MGDLQDSGAAPFLTPKGPRQSNQISADEIRAGRLGLRCVFGDRGCTGTLRCLCYQHSFENPLTRIGYKMCATAGPFHMAQAAAECLHGNLFHRTASEVGSGAWEAEQMEKRSIFLAKFTYHARMDWHVDVRLPAYIRAIALRHYGHLLGRTESGDVEALRMLSEEIRRYFLPAGPSDAAHNVHPWLASQLYVLLQLRNLRDAIRAGDVGMLTRLSRSWLVLFAALGSKNYVVEELTHQAMLLSLPPYFARVIQEARLVNTSGKADGWKGIDLIAEEMVRELKQAVGSLSNEALDDKLRTVSTIMDWLVSVDQAVYDMFSEPTSTRPTGLAAANKFSPPQVTNELEIRRLVDVILRSGVLEHGPDSGQPRWMSEGPVASMEHVCLTGVQKLFARFGDDVLSAGGKNAVLRLQPELAGTACAEDAPQASQQGQSLIAPLEEADEEDDCEHVAEINTL